MHINTRSEVVRGFGSIVVCTALILAAATCTKQEAKSVLEAGVKAVVDETCQETGNEAGLPPDVVALTCPAIGEASVGLVNVLMPRTAWEQVKARRYDGGKGK